jgi:phospholipid/cholesterol/gamma-HCH transport system substrate-binding protein
MVMMGFIAIFKRIFQNMDMEFSKLERMVGTFVIGVCLLLIATIVIIGRGKDWFETYITFYTTFKESYNLQDSAAVKLFKADIGRVKSITLEKDSVRVKLIILEKYASRIRQDAIAVVESPTFIGSEYISIIPGSPQSPLIPEQGEIPSKEKRSINDIMTEFEVERTAKMVVKSIQDISDVANDLSNPKGPLRIALDNFEKTSSHIEGIAADLRAGKGPLGTVLKSEDLLRQILANIDRMGEILDNINETTAKAPKAMDLVQENLDTYVDVGQSVVRRVEQARVILDEIQSSTADLKTTLKNIKAGSYNVPRISTSFRDGVQEIREGVEEINRVVESLQKSFLIRDKLPDRPEPMITDAHARP